MRKQVNRQLPPERPNHRRRSLTTVGAYSDKFSPSLLHLRPSTSFSPSIPLEAGPETHLGGLGSAVSSPSGLAAEPQSKSNLIIFSLKIWHLVAKFLMILLVMILSGKGIKVSSPNIGERVPWPIGIDTPESNTRWHSRMVPKMSDNKYRNICHCTVFYCTV